MNLHKILFITLLCFSVAACSDPDTSSNANNANNTTPSQDTSLQDTSDVFENTQDTTPDASQNDTLEDTTDDTSEPDTNIPPPTPQLVGILDTTFAPHAPTPGFFVGPTHLRSDGSGLALLPSADILVAGRGRLTPESQPADYPKMFTLHLDNTGELVPEFAENGLAILPFGPEENDIVVLTTSLQTDNKTVSCGNIRSTELGRAQLVVTRLNTDGTPDPTFGNTPQRPGIAYFDVPTDKPNSLCWTLHILNDGKILVGGQIGANSTMIPLLMRLNPDGTLDPTFGNDPETPGVTLHDIAPNDKMLYAKIREITVLPNNQILALVDSAHLQTSRQNGYLLRFSPDGKLDESFGNGGLVTLELPEDAGHEVFDFSTDPTTNRVYITGKVQYARGLSIYRFFVHALTTDGQPVADFTTYILPDINAAARSVLVQPDGKIVATGSAITHPKPAFEAGHLLAVRLLPDGQLDTEFATNGIFSHEDPNLYFYAARAQLDAQNRLVITGSTPVEEFPSPRGHTFITRLR